MFRAQACNLWLVEPDGGSMKLAQQDGQDPTVEVGAAVPIDTGHLANVAQTGNPRLIENPAEDESLAERLKAGGEEFEVQSLIAAPLTKETQVIGVIELVNKTDGTPFNEDDLFFLSSIAEQAAVALHNANLLESERKLHTMHALLKISQEITSTLDLDHVLTTVVHQASTAVPFDRCAIGFFDRSKFVLGAVSGETEVPKNDEMTGLRKLLEWVSTQDTAVRADKYEEGWEVDPESGQPIIVPYLEEHGVNGFYALPLRDDQGTVGVLCLQSESAEFLNEGQRETVDYFRQPDDRSDPQRAALSASAAGGILAAVLAEEEQVHCGDADVAMGRVGTKGGIRCGGIADRAVADAREHECYRGACAAADDQHD